MLNVAAYCRVSTDKDDQANSFESQKRYFEEYINRNPDWELTEIYADEGLTGTTTKKRKAFNKMIADAHLGKFDRVLTKEVSRFARNTVDTLQFTRELRAINIGVLFMLDNIDTLAPDGELRLTIMASLAQEESRKTSERVKWGQRRQMEKGVVFGRDMLGYDVHNGKLYINEEGAEVVRLIFHKFVNEKKGTCTIGRELREAGYKTITGNAMWTNTVILKALRNEKYCGDLIQKKTYTPDYLTHSKKYNHGEEDFVIIRNHHEPIISREMWDMAQEELNKKAPNEEIKSKHSNRYPLSGKIVCGCCGCKFVARSKKRKDGSRYKAWRCYNAAQYGTSKIDNAGNHIGCDVKSQIRDEDFMLVIQKVVECLDVNRDAILKGLTDILKTVFSYEHKKVLDETEIQKKLSNLTSKKERLLDLYLSEDLSKEDYREKKSLYETEIAQLEAILKSAAKETVSYDCNQAINDITEYMNKLLYATERDEIFYKNLVEKIVVHSREDIDVYLNLLPYKWKVVLNSVLSADDLCGSILSPTYLPLIENDGSQNKAMKLAEIPVFERCLKYGTSLQQSPARTSKQPEMTVGINLYMDNRISLYAAQYGRCAVMGMELSIDEIHCHHKIPINMGGTDEYSNLIILHRNVHTLIHATNTETIRAYLDIVAPDAKTLDKINKLRIMAGNSKINRK